LPGWAVKPTAETFLGVAGVKKSSSLLQLFMLNDSAVLTMGTLKTKIIWFKVKLSRPS
jgi:hypothetical protein